MTNGFAIAAVALLSVLTGLAVVAVAQFGITIGQLADLKAYVMTVISKMNDTGYIPNVVIEETTKGRMDFT